MKLRELFLPCQCLGQSLFCIFVELLEGVTVVVVVVFGLTVVLPELDGADFIDGLGIEIFCPGTPGLTCVGNFTPPPPLLPLLLPLYDGAG